MGFSDISEAFTRVKTKIDSVAHDCNRPGGEITLIAVSKQQQEDRIEAGLATGHRIFGENRVQEAKKRWTNGNVIILICVYIFLGLYNQTKQPMRCGCLM